MKKGWLIAIIAIILVFYTMQDKKESGRDYVDFLSYVHSYIEGDSLSEFSVASNNWIGSGDFTYIEGDFEFSYSYPIYGLEEVKDHNDFSEKCFAGICNRENVRHIVCTDNGQSTEVFTYPCVAGAYNQGPTFCVNGQYINPSGGEWTDCSKPTILNVYYLYNEWDGYEGYDSNWQQRWQPKFVYLRNYLQQFNINLDINYYEYQLEDDSTMPAFLSYPVYTSHPAYSEGDVHATIFAGANEPEDYGISCPTNWPTGCYSYSTKDRMGLQDYSADTRTVLHEYGHSQGCDHPGTGQSLGDDVYKGGAMSWNGTSEWDYHYECRIAMYFYGENE